MKSKQTGILTSPKENEELYRLIIETAIDVVYTTNTEGYFTYANPRVEILTGYTADELIGRHYTNLLEGDWRKQVEEFYREQFKNFVYETTFTVPLKTKSGDLKWIEQTVRLISDGKWIHGYHGIARDITDRRSAEDRLRQSEKDYRNLFESAHDAIMILSEKEEVLEVNQRACEVYGLTKDEFVGMNMEKVSTDKGRGVQAVKSTIKKGKHGFESVHVRKNGEKMYLEINASLISYQGKPAILSINRDVTEKKLIQEEKESLQQQFLQSQKMEAVGTLAAGVAHDFTNMLTVISGHSELMMAKIDEANPLNRELKQIIMASARASDLTRKLLLFSRKEKMELSNVNLNVLTQDLLKMLKRLIGEDIAITTELCEDLAFVRADPGNIEQVVMNLTVNSRDAMQDGGTLWIRTENVTLNNSSERQSKAAREGKFVRLSVTDNGVGMDPELIKHIFEPFFTTKEAGKGSGLGLSVVYGIVQQHGGWVDVSSTLGKGSKFSVYLPAILEKVEPEQPQIKRQENLLGNQTGVLVVEDDEVVRDVVRRTLEQYDYHVHAAENRQAAMDLFHRYRKQIRIVFSDVVLPDGNGISLVEDILNVDSSIKIILCSGYMDDKSKWPTINKKGLRFFYKPYAIKDLLRGLKEELETA